MDNLRKEIPFMPWRAFTRRTKRERTFHVERKERAEGEGEIISAGKSLCSKRAE